VAVLAACSSSSAASRASTTTVAPTTTSTTAAPTTTTAVPATTVAPSTTSSTVKVPATTPTQPTTATTTAPGGSVITGAPLSVLAGKVITLNPGHDGGNASHTSEINKPLWIGTKWITCDTAGTTTNDGYPEHAFNWDVAQRTAALLRAAGATVVLTRPDDTGWGPCVDERAAIANRAHSAAVVSIHADGGPASGRGFHVIYPPSIPGLTDDIAAASSTLAHAVHDAVRRGTPMPTATYVGSGDGYSVRSDLGGLTLSNVPSMFIECANMRNATDAQLIENPAFRQQLAAAIAQGLADFIAGR
jgi:N-acetylmuramoyl-L-alanine amidase